MAQVWIVDDNTAIREMLYDALILQGHQVTTVGSGTQAVEMLKTRRPQCILLDCDMPGFSGLETAREIRSFDEVMAIVLMSEGSVIDKEFERLGIHDQLDKGAEQRQFLEAATGIVARAVSSVKNNGQAQGPKMRVPATLLIVDDDPQILRLMMSFFAERGIRVLLADSGEAALKELSKSPSMVLMDVNMPGMDGLMTLKRIKQVSPNLPVIMISGVGEDATIRSALEMGAHDYITKPFSLEYLETVVLTKILLGIED